MRGHAIETAREAGALLMERLAKPGQLCSKGDISNVVTEADVASERLIVNRLRRDFSDHSIVAEEMGCDLRSSDYTWIVDPLDGTSNFAAGVPWFGVLLALMQQQNVVLGVMFLPAMDLLYVAEAGCGCTCNGQSVRVSASERLEDVLWAYGMDAPSDNDKGRAEVALLSALLARVRNVRTTNSLLDAAFTADGRFGGMLNHSTKLWDVAAPSLIVSEAGGAYTDLAGRPLALALSEAALEREYAVVAGASALHRQVLALIDATQGGPR